jgi:predicted AAA+ superfamily ATPase
MSTHLTPPSTHKGRRGPQRRGVGGEVSKKYFMEHTPQINLILWNIIHKISISKFRLLVFLNLMYHQRILTTQIQNACFQWKAIIIYGARQVGKTTLCKNLRWNDPHTLYVTGDDFSIVQLLTNVSLVTLHQRLQGYTLVVIDEAQKIQTIWNTLKLIVDNIPEVQVIATWSSSFDLANHVQEPLTWRTTTFYLHPLTLEEIWQKKHLHERNNMLEQRIIYGMYPRMVLENNANTLFEIAQAYVYKDIFLYENLRKPDLIIKLLQALALQIWSEVSYNELSQLLFVDVKTVQKYIWLLEQAFIIFRLPSLARNLRNELKRGQKIYFRDTGIRNGLLKNMQPLATRTDKWVLWENFVISERMKYMQNHALFTNHFFWRTTAWQEIDYIETDHGSSIDAYEITRSATKKKTMPEIFARTYPSARYQVIHQENRSHFLLPHTFA